MSITWGFWAGYWIESDITGTSGVPLTLSAPAARIEASCGKLRFPVRKQLMPFGKLTCCCVAVG